MKSPLLSRSELASFFGVSEERIRQQYEANAKELEQMRNKALATGKKHRGFTSAELTELTSKAQINAQ